MDKKTRDYIEHFRPLAKHFHPMELIRHPRTRTTLPVPPRSLWPNMVATLSIADDFREELGLPLYVSSGYRPEPFNQKWGGIEGSRHTIFAALDLNLKVSDRTRKSRATLASIAIERMATAGECLKMGLGIYNRGARIHIDTLSRDYPAQWGIWVESKSV